MGDEYSLLDCELAARELYTRVTQSKLTSGYKRWRHFSAISTCGRAFAARPMIHLLLIWERKITLACAQQAAVPPRQFPRHLPESTLHPPRDHCETVEEAYGEAECQDIPHSLIIDHQ